MFSLLEIFKVFLISIISVSVLVQNFSFATASNDEDIEIDKGTFTGFESSYENQNEFNSLMLQTHNFYRLKYKMPILRLDVQLLKSTKEMSSAFLANRHRYDLLERWPRTSPYGENTYIERTTIKQSTHPPVMVRHWYHEIEYLKPALDFNHFREIRNVTQLLWKSTKRMGCSYVRWKGDDYVHSYLICHYYPPAFVAGLQGNFIDPLMIFAPILWSIENGTFFHKPILFLLLVPFISLLYRGIS